MNNINNNVNHIHTDFISNLLHINYCVKLFNKNISENTGKNLSGVERGFPVPLRKMPVPVCYPVVRWVIHSIRLVLKV